MFKKGQIAWNKGLKTGSLSVSHREKIGQGNRGKKRTVQQKKKISDAKKGDKNPMKRLDVRLKVSNSLKGRSAWNKGKKMPPMSENHKEKIRKSMLGKNTFKKSKEARKKMSVAKQGCKRSKESVRKSNVGIKAAWANPEIRDKQVRAIILGNKISANKVEVKMWDIINKMYPNEWKFVGDGQLIINGKCPDFVNINGKKLLIEVFGDYWHRDDNPKERIKVFEPYGYRTLVLWEHNIVNDCELVKSEIRSFVELEE